jgi:hypothetical protein
LLELELAHCCHRELSWECELQRREYAVELPKALVPEGYTLAADHGFMLQLEHAEGQVLILVPRTGRVQLRLPYTTPSAERRPLAERLAAQIGNALRAYLGQ